MPVTKLAREKVAPLSSKMDREGKVEPGIVKSLFENGVSMKGKRNCIYISLVQKLT